MQNLFFFHGRQMALFYITRWSWNQRRQSRWRKKNEARRRAKTNARVANWHQIGDRFANRHIHFDYLAITSARNTLWIFKRIIKMCCFLSRFGWGVIDKSTVLSYRKYGAISSDYCTGWCCAVLRCQTENLKISSFACRNAQLIWTRWTIRLEMR